ncbi:EcsC family protein [Poseidonocella sedimentorum]|uniref:EcsC protein family protein n=1 Tax=Poseidonocella sedimentorum TaxID=871652 RepID=A0A1I6E048_9RHOB|nr:EcsC family protein [Poseidonocella sedimentorum]SFR11055.1 EcsC protein family protein [Poseidonocella sedimentorum]
MAEQSLEGQIADLAQRYRRANSPGMQLLTLLGGQAEGLLDRLPRPLRAQLDGATERALLLALNAAEQSRGVVGDQPDWLNKAVTSAMGAAGGVGGIPTALAELPVTTAILLRSIQGIAAEQGFDPTAENVRFDCLEVFGAAGPLSRDDGADMGFLTARMALSGATMQRVVAMVAPRLGAVLGQKLAAQSVPVIGAVAGAATNYTFTSYYQEIARVHFGLRRMAIEHDRPHDELVLALQDRVRGGVERRAG